MINHLSAGLAEITQQGIAAAKEAQHYKAECDALDHRLQSREAEFLCEVRLCSPQQSRMCVHKAEL